MTQKKKTIKKKAHKFQRNSPPTKLFKELSLILSNFKPFSI
jgi:hypothetical protein